MSAFKFLPLKDLEKNFNDLAKKELEKHGALDDFSKLEKANKDRADQLSLIDDLFDQLKQVEGMAEEEKSKIITGALLKVRNDIGKTYKYTPEFLILSVLYNGTPAAVGVTKENKLDAAAEKEAAKAYQQHLLAVETEARFAAYRKTEAYKHYKAVVNTEISRSPNDTLESGVVEEALYPNTLNRAPVDHTVVKDDIHYFADKVGFEVHFKDDQEALERYKKYEGVKDTVTEVNKKVEAFKPNMLHKPSVKALTKTEEEKLAESKGKYVTSKTKDHFNTQILSQVGSFNTVKLRDAQLRELKAREEKKEQIQEKTISLKA